MNQNDINVHLNTLRDKIDNSRGLVEKDTEARQVTTYQHIIQIDSRDCVGIGSLECARSVFEANGGRKEESGQITGTSPMGTYPTKIIVNTTSVNNNQIRNGDVVYISGVQGNTVINNSNWRISNLTVPDLSLLPYSGSSFTINSISSGNYAGGGIWFRRADNGYPAITENTNVISGNEMTIQLQKRLKVIRSIALNVSIIPRDIIPLISYYKDLYETTDNDDFVSQTYIPQEKKFMELNSYGFYSTDISLFRTYDGDFAMPNQVTPPPLNLWNPLPGAWPNQPISYSFQTVPTYKSGNITVPSSSDINYIMCSGYGVYDLNDWTASTREETETARKALLVAIVRSQMINSIDLATLIENCETTSNGVSPFGYGQFQRFLPGPGLQLNYQPGTSDGADPSIADADWPIAFPGFRGNVWGPYDSPGDRFQKVGLRDTLQDLFLNGDLDNLFGTPVIKPNVKTNQLINDSDYGITSGKCIETVNFSNIANSTNLNILNAMRIVPNGFGAASVIAQGQGNPDYTNVYQNSGGIGPSGLGAPSAWSLTGVYGAPSIDDPNAVGPLSWNLLTNGTVPQSSVGNDPNTYIAQTSSINHRFSWYDSGAANGLFKTQMKSYILYCISNLPSTNLVIKCFQFPRDERVQSTNTDVASSILNIPVRLLPDISSDGGFQYVESLLPLLSQASDLEYWGKRFLTPMASLDKITLSFFTYEGVPIPLERQLSYRCGCRSKNMSPLLRSKRELSLLLRAECYQYVNPGLNINEKIMTMLKETEISGNSFAVRASNYEDYS